MRKNRRATKNELAGVPGPAVTPPGVGGASLPSYPAQFAMASLVFALALGVYAATLAPTVSLVDSGELIVAARTLGVAHPPGFPLYVLLAHLATLLPFGNIAARVNFASAFFAACAAGTLTLVAAEAARLGAAGAERRRHGDSAPRLAAAAHRVAPTMLPAVISGLLLAFSRTLWSYATIAEVYTLNTWLIVLLFWLMLIWRRRMAGARISPQRSPADGPLYAAAFCFGLGLGVHHVTVGLCLPGLAALVYATQGRAFFSSRRFVCAALCAFGGLTVYAYLPLAALHDPVFNWGDPRTLQRLWWHVTGRQFQAYFALSARQIATELVQFATLTSRELGPWWCPLALVLAALGLRTLFAYDRALLVCFILVLVADVGYGISYEIAEDKPAYYLPAFIVIAITAGCGVQALLQRAARLPGSYVYHAALAMVLFIPFMAGAANLRYNDRHQYFVAQDYVDNISSTIEPGGMLLTLDWQVCSPFLYVRTIEQRRRDVMVIDINLMRRSWYFGYLQREYPELIEATREQVDSFLDDLSHWEQDPALYQRDLTLNQRIDSRFNNLVLAFVSAHLRSAPVYVTEDVALGTDAESGRLAKALGAAYELVPQGLVFQLFGDRLFHEPAAPHLLRRGLTDGTLWFEADDVVRQKVLPVYASMLYNRGRYLGLHGRQAAAVAAFAESLTFDPGFMPAQRALAQ